MEFAFSSVLYLWSAAESWHFVNIPEHISTEIKEVSAPFRRGFGSVRVDVTCGSSCWRTSVFPDSKLGCYVLPIKLEVRKRENLSVGDLVELKIELVDF